MNRIIIKKSLKRFKGIWGILFFVIIIGVIITNNYRKIQFQKFGKITVGEIINITSDESDVIVLFEVNGKKYQTYFFNSGNYVIGEKFEVMYSEKNPDINRVVISNPIFLKDEKTSFVEGVISRKYMGNIIAYKYEIKGINYIKDLECKHNIFRNLEIGQTFPVEFLIDHPARSIMRFNLDERSLSD